MTITWKNYGCHAMYKLILELLLVPSSKSIILHLPESISW